MLGISMAIVQPRTAGGGGDVEPQTINTVFGANSRSGAGSGIPVSASSISSGDDNAYWQITGGYLCPTVAGDTADLGGDGAVYILTLSDGSIVNISIEGDTWSISSQAEWTYQIGQIVASPATYRGKTLRVRRLPNDGVYTSGVTGASGLRRVDLRDGSDNPLVIRGDDTSIGLDSDDEAAATSYPLFDGFIIQGVSGLTFRYIDTAESGASKFTINALDTFHCEDITIDNCRLRGIQLDPHGNFTNGPGTGTNQYPNTAHAIATATSDTAYPYCGPLTITNNFISWTRRGINAIVGAGILTTSGNRIKYFYDDGINVSYPDADVLWLCDDNVLSHPVGSTADTPIPHVDAIRGIGSITATTDWTVKIRRNRIWMGDARGEMQLILLSDFKSGTDSGHFFIAEVTGNICVAVNTVGIQIENAKNCIVLNNTMVCPTFSPAFTPSIYVGAVLPTSGASTDATNSGVHIIRRNAADAFRYEAGNTLEDNVTLSAPRATSYAAAFDAPGDPDTLAELMAMFNMKAAGTLDIGATYGSGAIGSGAVTYASTVPGNDGSSVNELTPVDGDPIALEILDVTAINDAGNINANGWVAAVTFKGMAAGELLDGTQITINVDRAGFDSAGAATTVPVTINGTTQLSRPLPQTWANGLTIDVGERVLSTTRLVGADPIDGGSSQTATRIYECSANPGLTVTGSEPTHLTLTPTAKADGITWTYVGSVTANSAVVNSQSRSQIIKQYLSNEDGADAIAYGVLDDFIYGTDTITSATVFAGAYDSSSNASLDAVITLTNSSTMVAPKPDVAWITPPHQLVRSGETHRVELTAVHPYGQQSRMVAAVKFTAYDDSNVATSLTRTVTAMTASTILTTTYGHPVPVFGVSVTQAEMAAAGLADGQYSWRAQVFSFAGLEWDSDTDGFGPTGTWSISTKSAGNNAKRIHFELDSDNTVSIYYAKVAAGGNDTTGVASTTIATARATPCATINGAAAKINTANGSTKAGVIMIEGGLTLTGFGGSLDSSKTYGTVWLTIRKDPADGGVATINADTVTAANRVCGLRTKFENLTLNAVGTSPVINNAEPANSSAAATHELWFDNCILTGTGSQAPLSAAGWFIIYNSSLTSTVNLTGNSRNAFHMLAGSTLNAAGTNGAAISTALHALGNKFQLKATISNVATRYWNDNTQAAACSIYGWNSWYNCTQNIIWAVACNGSNDGGTTATTLPYTAGASWVSNLIEANTDTTKGGQICADAVTTTCPRLYFMWNTSAGDGFNALYNDTNTGGVGQVLKIGYIIGNLSADRNYKNQYYDLVAAKGDRTGNHAVRFGVAAKYNFVYGIGSFDAVPSPKNQAGDYYEQTSTFSGVVGFTNDLSKKGTSTPGAGNGDYRPTTISAAKSIVPAAAQMLPIDLNGTARRTDGTGVPGAFEWA
jgi:hypothetical protein